MADESAAVLLTQLPQFVLKYFWSELELQSIVECLCRCLGDRREYHQTKCKQVVTKGVLRSL